MATDNKYYQHKNGYVLYTYVNLNVSTKMVNFHRSGVKMKNENQISLFIMINDKVTGSGSIPLIWQEIELCARIVHRLIYSLRILD